MRVQLAADPHGVDHAGEHVVEILDRLGLHVVVERLEQRGDRRRDLRVEQEADVDRGLAQARLAEQALLERADVEGQPVDAAPFVRAVHASVMSPPCLPVATVLCTRVRQDIERRRLACRRSRPRCERCGAGHPLRECAPLPIEVPLHVAPLRVTADVRRLDVRGPLSRLGSTVTASTTRLDAAKWAAIALGALA